MQNLIDRRLAAAVEATSTAAWDKQPYHLSIAEQAGDRKKQTRRHEPGSSFEPSRCIRKTKGISKGYARRRSRIRE